MYFRKRFLGCAGLGYGTGFGFVAEEQVRVLQCVVERVGERPGEQTLRNK